MTVSLNIRLEALAEIKTGISIRNTAGKYGVSVRTVQSWLKWQREGGPEAAGRKADIAEEAFLLKERFPGCAVRRAVKFLTRRGYALSDRTVWEIWRRFGLAGYRKDSATASYLAYIAHTPETDQAQAEAERLLKDGDIAGAAIQVNQMSSCPNAEALLAIPDEQLSLRRRLDKLYPLSDRIPLALSFQKAKELRRAMFACGLIYSGLRAGVLEQKNLLLMGRIKEGLSLTARIEPLLPKRGDPALQFIFHYTKAQLLNRSFGYSQARQSIAKCRILARSLKQPFYVFSLGAILCEAGNYRKAIGTLERLLPKLRQPYCNKALQDLAIMHDIAGRHSAALKLMPPPENQNAPMAYHYMKFKARHSLAQGHVKASIDMIYRTLQNPGCLKTMPALFPVVNDLYCLYAGLGQSPDQRERLSRISELCRKEGSVLSYYLGSILLGKPVHIPAQARRHPLLRIALCLKEAHERQQLKLYREARRIADRFGLWGRLQFFCLAYPWPVRALLRLGRATGLPKAMQQLPVFNQEKPAVKVNLLGRLQLYRDGKLIRGHLQPKDAALLIHLVLSPGQELPVDKVLSNFWPKAAKAHSDLAHALLRLRRALQLPAHLLSAQDETVKAKFHVVTDAGEWRETIKIAQACEAAGKGDLARSEWLKAFALFRGAPFRGMYDDWSDERRNDMMLVFDRRALEFAKAEQEAGRNASARRLLKKILGIDPSSDEAREMLKGRGNK
jgi:DNA-binding SARP family transcriptional activator/transposase